LSSQLGGRLSVFSESASIAGDMASYLMVEVSSTTSGIIILHFGYLFKNLKTRNHDEAGFEFTGLILLLFLRLS